MKSYGECTTEELFNFNHTNFIKFFEWYTKTPKGNMYQNDRILRYETEITGPLWYGILTTSCKEEEADDLIEEQMNYFHSKGYPGFMWYVISSTNPPNMSEKLEAHDFSKIDTTSPMMSIDLYDLPERKEIPGLEIKPVRSKEEMRKFDKVLETQFPLGEEVFKKIYDIECSYGFDEECARQLYVAYQDGVPVSTNFMILDGDVAGMYKTATRPDYCRRGIGTAITLDPLYDAKDKGYKVGVLQSTEAGFKVYSRLGFKEDGKLDWYMYTWDKEAKVW